MSPPTKITYSMFNFRLILVSLTAISASLPMAWISLAKVFIFIFCLVYLTAHSANNNSDSVFQKLWTPWVIMAVIAAFSLSLLWTTTDSAAALVAFVKHSKLLEILILLSLIRTADEARIGITAFAAGQIFLLSSSWLLAAGIQIPWRTSSTGQFVVFSTYLDQSIIFATTAGVLWHLQSDNLWPRWLAVIFSGAALVNVLLLLEGRTGYVVALTVLSLAVMWAMPKSLRLGSLIVTPVIVLLFVYFGSTQVQHRIALIFNESQTYAEQGESTSSSGWRLHSWLRSAQAIKASPYVGHGVGSWAITVKKLEGDTATTVFSESNTGNPHQEFLLWGVELGFAGTLLLIALITCFIRDALRFKKSIARSIISVCAALTTACMFNSTLYDALIGDYFCITLGLLFALGIRSQSTQKTHEKPMPELIPSKVAA